MKQKKDLLAGGDEKVKFTINRDYAANYNTWRQKERLQTLKDRYGGVSDAESSTSEEEDENARELTKDVEKNFFRALSCLKQKDPRIYDSNIKFFDQAEGGEPVALTKIKKEKPFLLRDHQRRVILEKSGKFVDDEGEELGVEDITPVQEQNAIKESFKQFLANSDDEEQGDWGGLFQKKKKTKEEMEKEEDDYRMWLKGQKEDLPDKALARDMKYLHDYWNDPDLNVDEAFLKDYVLNRRFLESDDEDYVPRFPDIDVEDEDKLAEQEEFEHKYNFRFEKEDPEFIKRYPRTVENSMRRKDNRRSKARHEVKQRKERERLEKTEELKQLKALKKKELLEKIEKIKAVTGNTELAFKDEDLDGDFDPDAHDRKMQELFNDNYYGDGGEDKEKPVFLDDDEMEIENWNDWNGDDDQNFTQNDADYQEGTSNEAAEFNMDCDYDPQAEVQNELIHMSKSKKKRKRQSKLAQALARAKPVFDPSDKTFDEYLDEYYKLDYEDIIDGMPTRFKYRQTTPNDYGLSVDEILRADEKELNQWCSLRKVVKLKPEDVERYELQAYAKKAANEAMKRKILPSLYRSFDENPEEMESITFASNSESGYEKGEQLGLKRKKKQGEDSEKDDEMQVTPTKKLKKNKPSVIDNGADSSKSSTEKGSRKKTKARINGADQVSEETQTEGTKREKKKKKKRKKKKAKAPCVISEKKTSKVFKKKNRSFEFPISDVRLKAYGLNPKKFKNKVKYGKRNKLSGKDN